MRILYIISNTRIGGAERHLLKIARCLRSMHPDWALDCLVTHEHGVLQSEYEQTFENVFFTDIDPAPYDIVHSINNFIFMQAFQQRHPDKHYCACVWMDMGLPCNEQMLAILKDPDSKYCALFSEHADNFNYLPTPQRAPHILQQVQNGIDSAFWTPGEVEKKRQVCWVGHMVDRKNAPDLPAMITQYPDIHFVIVSTEYRWDGPYATFKTLLDMVPTHPNLDLRWNLTPEEMREVYRESQCYLMNTKSSCQSGALLEAMSCGCIPVVSDIPSFYEILSPGYPCGHVVNAKTDQVTRIASFAYFIKTFGFDSTRKDPRRRIVEDFDMWKCIKQYADAYQEIVK